MSAKDKPFTRLAAELTGTLGRLDAGQCPTCGNEIGIFRDRLSEKEFEISGMCQTCQDVTFSNPDEKTVIFNQE